MLTIGLTGTARIRFRQLTRLVATTLAGVGALATSRCEAPFDLRDHTSCGELLYGGVPAEGSPRVNPSFVTVFTGFGRSLEACFYGDEVRDAERQAIRWSSDDPTLATVDPATGPRTVVSGHGFGVTHVRAVITGVSVPVVVVVCDESGACPPPPYR
ncbi:MAG: hypothetical protein KJ067_11685 [Vicinamibacteria bacterium]|nr:hypothetical protein [Vicinamibacteria bacterium]